MWTHDLIYNSPHFAFLLIGTPLALFLFWQLYEYRKKSLDPFYAKPILTNLVSKRSTQLFWIQSALFSLAWFFAVIAVMQPKGNGRYPDEPHIQPKESQKAVHTIRRKSHEVLFFLDTSNSMAIVDTRVSESRLNYAKEIIEGVVSQLLGEDVALYSFTSEVTPLVPATLDYLYMRLMLNQVSLNEGDIPGTDFSTAMSYLHDKILTQESPQKLKTVILFSDGGDTQLETLKGSSQEKFIAGILKNVSDAKEFNLRLFTVGMGSIAGGDVPDISFEGHPIHSGLEKDLLKALAESGRGRFYDSNDYTSMSLAKELVEQMAQDNPYTDEISAHAMMRKDAMIYDLYYQFPLGLAIIFLWLGLQLPVLGIEWKRWGLHRFWIFLGALMLIQGSLLAEVSESASRTMHLAEGYYDTEQYVKAQELYNNLLKEVSTQWEKEILNYNINCCLVAENRLQEFLSSDRTVPQGTFPPLERNTLFNYAIALIKKGEAFQDRNKALASLHEALIVLQKVREKDCEIAKLEGAPDCGETAQDLIATRNQINEKLIKLSIFGLGETAIDKSLIKLIGGLQYIQSKFSDALLEYPLLESTITDLEKSLGEVKGVSIDLLSRANQYLQLSKAALIQNKQHTARTFLLGSSFLIKQSQLSLKDRASDAKGILTQAITLQDQALQMASSTSEAFHQEGASDPLKATSAKFQTDTVQTVIPFVSSVINQERKDFEKRCQDKPWDQVIPLYQKGYEASADAEKEMGLAAPSWTKLTTNQQIALISWKAALNKMKQAEAQQSPETQEKEENKPEQMQPSKPTSASMNQLMQVLEEMEQEDKLHPSKNATEKEVERPW